MLLMEMALRLFHLIDDTFCDSANRLASSLALLCTGACLDFCAMFKAQNVTILARIARRVVVPGVLGLVHAYTALGWLFFRIADLI